MTDSKTQCARCGAPLDDPDAACIACCPNWLDVRFGPGTVDYATGLQNLLTAVEDVVMTTEPETPEEIEQANADATTATRIIETELARRGDR